jgi:hypothetical protein
MCIEGGQTVSELCRESKADCVEGNRHLVSRVKCREIVNCELNLQFFKPKRVGNTKYVKGERKMEK